MDIYTCICGWVGVSVCLFVYECVCYLKCLQVLDVLCNNGKGGIRRDDGGSVGGSPAGVLCVWQPSSPVEVFQQSAESAFQGRRIGEETEGEKRRHGTLLAYSCAQHQRLWRIKNWSDSVG